MNGRQWFGRVVVIVMACLALAMAGGAPSDNHINGIGEIVTQLTEIAQ